MKLLQLSAQPESIQYWASHPLKRLIDLPTPRPKDFWVLVDSGGMALGRVGAGVSLSRPELGWIGFFELQDSEDSRSAATLLEKACSFLKASGSTRAVGPLHLNTWLPYRFSLPSQDSLRFIWEPHQPASYPKHWKNSGFHREMLYCSEGHGDFAGFIERIKPTWQSARAAGYSFRKINPDTLLDEELPILHRLSMAGFADNHLFEPLTESLFRELYVPLAGKNARQNLSLSGFVLSPQGKEVGFAFSFLDSSQNCTRIVLKTATILPEYRGKGLSNALFFETLGFLDPKTHPEFVSALVREGAQSQSYGSKHPRLWRHEYELLQKPL